MQSVWRLIDYDHYYHGTTKTVQLSIESQLFGTMRIAMSTVLLMVILFAGLVGSARLYLKAHSPGELWGGYLVGIGTQLVAFWIVY
ncbi:MAG: hypothetical protein R2769_01165 [Saprospiraceae bacterium]